MDRVKVQESILPNGARILLRKELGELEIRYKRDRLIIYSAQYDVGNVPKLEDLRDLDINTKVAFVGERLFVRHSDAWTSKWNGGFVEQFAIVSAFTIVPQTAVIAGCVEIIGFQVIEDGQIIGAKKEEIIPEGRILEAQEISKIGKLTIPGIISLAKSEALLRQ